MTVSDDDLLLLADYLEGRMPDELERCRFEERLSTEPELAEYFEAYTSVDQLAERVATSGATRGATEPVATLEPSERRTAPPAPRLLRSPLAMSVLAIAAAALVWFILDRPTGPDPSEAPSRLRFDSGVLASARGVTGYNQVLRASDEELDGLAPYLEVAMLDRIRAADGLFAAPPDPTVARSSADPDDLSAYGALALARARLVQLARENGLEDETVPVAADHPAHTEITEAQREVDRARAACETSVETYLELAQPLLDARARRARDVDETIRAGLFHVSLELDREASVLVFLVTPDGALRDGAMPSRTPWYGPAFPVGAAVWTADSGRLGAGTTFLPAPPLERTRGADDVPIVATDLGFDVPFRSGQVQVLIAVRDAPLDRDLQERLEAFARMLAPLDDGATGADDATIDALMKWLDARGFVLEHQLVREQPN